MESELSDGLRRYAEELYHQGIDTVKAGNLIQNQIDFSDGKMIVSDVKLENFRFDLNRYKNIFVIGAGKASAQMAKSLENLLGSRLSGGVVITKSGFTSDLKTIQLIEASHPLPDENGLAGSKLIKKTILEANESDLVIVLISGGASALMPAPIEGISLKFKMDLTEKLILKGADIEEVNLVRQSISELKGGRLAQLAYPADVLSLIISDVIGDPISIIGSGPTAHCEIYLKKVYDILSNYEFSKKTIDKLLSSAENYSRKNANQTNNKADNIIIGNNDYALSKIKKSIEQAGYRAVLIESKICGDVKKASKIYISEVKKILQHISGEGKVCIISGGETTVKVKGEGRGGRNMEFALNLIIDIAKIGNCVLLSAGSDGDDGNSRAAGAIIDSNSYTRSRNLNLDIKSFQENNDSNKFFELTEDRFVTGPTGTNVMDIQILLREND